MMPTGLVRWCYRRWDCRAFGLESEQVPVLVGTLGKAFGTAGAFVAGSDDLIESLIQFARPYIYTTNSQPPALACATYIIDTVRDCCLHDIEKV